MKGYQIAVLSHYIMQFLLPGTLSLILTNDFYIVELAFDENNISNIIKINTIYLRHRHCPV